jgi:hypothetical protein
MSVSSTKDMPQFIIDSDDRITGDIEEFDVKIDLKPNNNYDSVALVHCGIPRSFYNIDNASNSITISENGVEFSTALPAGDYTSATLPNNIKTQLDEISLANNPTTPWTYSCVWDTVSHKWIITVFPHAGRPINRATSYLRSNEQQTHDLLGLVADTDTYYNTGNVINPPYTANFHRTNYITVKSNICHNDGNNNPDSQILARIPVRSTPFGELLVYDLMQMEDGSKLLANNRSNLFSFGLYDDHGRVLGLNGRGWFMTLIVYEYNKLGRLQLKELEMVIRQREFEKERRIDEIDPNASSTINEPPVEQVLIEDGLLPVPTDIEIENDE